VSSIKPIVWSLSNSFVFILSPPGAFAFNT
jgi:hypothetical protein